MPHARVRFQTAREWNCRHYSESRFNESFEISARYLIGCDGAHSDIRHGIGVRFSGDAMVMQAQSTCILAPDLLGAMPNRAWAIYCLNSRSWGLTFAIDGDERWLIHNFAPNKVVDRDRSVREILGVGPSFHFKILAQEDWTGRRMIADRFRDRRGLFVRRRGAHLGALCRLR